MTLLSLKRLEEKMYEVGRICIKIAGRDAGREAVIIDILDDKLVLIDGNVRRRKCNVFHLEPTAKKVDIKKKASHEEVKAAFEKIGLGTWETKPRKTAERPKKVRKKKENVEEKKGVTKKTTKKEDKIVKEAKVVEEKKEPKKDGKKAETKETTIKKKVVKKTVKKE